VLDRKANYTLNNNKLCYNSTSEESGLPQQAALGKNLQAIDNKVQ
jgi:hypothetical protein